MSRAVDLAFEAPGGVTLAAALRTQLPDKSWNDVRKLCASGKVSVGGAVAVDPAQRLGGGERIELRMTAQAPVGKGPEGFAVVHEDGHLIVIEKPAGVQSVPFERGETGTALDLVRDEWRRQRRKVTTVPLFTVHRLDKETSGLLCFAKTRAAERGLHEIFQQHEASRTYLACAHGKVESARIETTLIPDRGDGLRGSLKPGQTPKGRTRAGAGMGRSVGAAGQLAVTHVTAIEPLAGATLCRVRLETGRTHQIRIHLAERRHPIVGETVYIRDLLRAGGTPIRSERLMLHAETLGFTHPVTGERLHWKATPPADFATVLERLRL